MSWSHPDISLEDLLKLFKGFVDILILASGYQSSGTAAHWDPHNIKLAFQWGLFFENVLRRLKRSENYQDSLKELDSALSTITSDSLYPQGLAHLSAVSLYSARNTVLEHLIHALPLRERHLRAIAEASIEMDLDELNRTELDSLSVYLDKLVLCNSSVCRIQDERDPLVLSQHTQNGDFTKLTIRELMIRRSRVSCISSIEAGLDILQKTVRQTTSNEEHLMEYQIWNRWRAQALSYFLDKETLRLVAGASMIFSAPSAQWVQVFDRLNASLEINGNHFRNVFEILLLGGIARRWSSLIDHFMSVSYDSLTTLERYHEVCSLLLGRSKTLLSSEEMMNAEEKGILEHLATMSGNNLHFLCNLPPVLTAVAIPSWSPLFRLYLSEVDGQLKGDCSTISRCSCVEEKMEHKECSKRFRDFKVVGSRRRSRSCYESRVLRQLMYKLRSKFKQGFKWERDAVIYSYDIYSYSRNFDNGCLDERISPLAPR